MSSLFERTMSKLKVAIQERGSIRAMSERLGMNPSTVSRWFAEGRSPDFRALADLLEHLGVQIIFPGDSPGSAVPASDRKLTERLEQLQEENAQLKADALRKEGAIDLLKEQLAAARSAETLLKPDSSASPSGGGQGRTA